MRGGAHKGGWVFFDNMINRTSRLGTPLTKKLMWTHGRFVRGDDSPFDTCEGGLSLFNTVVQTNVFL